MAEKTYTAITDVKYVGVPIGTVILFASNEAPEGDSWLLCNGNTVSKTEYPDLYNVIGDIWNTGNEDSSMFRLPDANNRYIAFQTNNSTYTPYASAGLPSYVHTHSGSSDIQGNHNHDRGSMEITGGCSGYRSGGWGAFWLSGTKGGDGGSGIAGNYSFKASRTWEGYTSENGNHSHTITVSANAEVNSGIYGKSSTVTPETIYMRAWIKAKNIK